VQIELDPLSEVPIYQQLRDRIVEAIARGQLLPGSPLTSVRQLAVAFGINVATVGKGYELLRNEGLILTNRKSGSVVARGPQGSAPAPVFLESWTPRLRTLVAEAVAQGVSREEVAGLLEETLASFELDRPAEGDAEIQKKDAR
jgi:GntR family transcriptional regulator